MFTAQSSFLWPRLGQRRWQALRQLCGKVTWLHRRPPGTECRDFQCWQLENSGLGNFLKSAAMFCLLVWQALCVLDLCEVPSMCDCSLLSCLHWHLVTWKEEFYTAKGSSTTEARLIWRWSALSACAVAKFSWMFRSGSLLLVWTYNKFPFHPRQRKHFYKGLRPPEQQIPPTPW